jgi:hypothetical protein
MLECQNEEQLGSCVSLTLKVKHASLLSQNINENHQKSFIT